MSARDVIEAALTQKGVVGVLRADYVIARLTAAGWRLVGPDEVDPVTVERCAQLVEDRRHIYHSRGNTAAAIRAIASGGKQ